jgi:ring-1,2-phenylacetyl-CoA epoxidase subunit PaaD
MVTESDLARARNAAAGVPDPEIPVLTIADLGILRDVSLADDGTIEIAITPTYSGCPAMNVIAQDVQTALARAGFPAARIRTVLSPAWTTEWLTEEARRKLRDYGIAPPIAGEPLACPHCGSTETERIAEFGSTPCKALWRCRACREPFDHFKCY